MNYQFYLGKKARNGISVLLLISPLVCQTAIAAEKPSVFDKISVKLKSNEKSTTKDTSQNPNQDFIDVNAMQIPDDDGEVDIADGFVIPDNAKAEPPYLSEDTPNIDIDTIAQQDPNIAQVANVPLGAISPSTIAKFVKTIDIVRNEYVDNIDDEQLFANAISGALTALDPYSEYLDSQAFENLRLFTEGDIGSIGVQVSFHTDKRMWVFDEVIANSPAAQQGIQVGYYLHQINDNKLNEDQTQQDVNQLLSGIAGTQVRLSVSDSGRRKHNLTIQRSLVEQQSIQAKIEQGVAIVQIPVFQNNTQQQIITALSSLDKPFSAVILDLRNNPGGVLSSANDVASMFMNKKTLVQVKNRQGLQEIMQTYNNARLPDVPLAIIQNRYSASAAEVLASSLKENKRAKIYGETSYGKGSIQSIVPIDNNEAVKLTVAHYYSGKGDKIDGVGVTADYPLIAGERDWENLVLQSVLNQPRPTYYQLNNPTITPQEY